jgi:hypothetical protein
VHRTVAEGSHPVQTVIHDDEQDWLSLTGFMIQTLTERRSSAT